MSSSLTFLVCLAHIPLWFRFPDVYFFILQQLIYYCSYDPAVGAMSFTFVMILMAEHYTLEKNMRDTFETNKIIAHHKQLLSQVSYTVFLILT